MYFVMIQVGFCET